MPESLMLSHCSIAIVAGAFLNTKFSHSYLSERYTSTVTNNFDCREGCRCVCAQYHR